MKKIKRVCLLNISTGERMDFAQDFIGTLSDKAILDMFYEIQKNVWIDGRLYKVERSASSITYYQYEVYKIKMRE